jgi:hypothetical protein
MVHIFHERSQFLEIYAAPSGWQPLAEPAWRLDLASRVLSKNGDATEFVLDPVSPVVQDLSTIFRPLEECETNLTVSSRLKKLYVKLLHYDLEFSTAVARLFWEAKNYPDFSWHRSNRLELSLACRTSLFCGQRMAK